MDASEAACLGHERDCVPRLLGSWCRFMESWLVATQISFIFTPKIGEDEPILTSIFFKGVETTN